MKNICFLIDHPFDLVLFLGLKNILKKDFGTIYAIALVTSHRYFLKVEEPVDDQITYETKFLNYLKLNIL